MELLLGIIAIITIIITTITAIGALLIVALWPILAISGIIFLLVYTTKDKKITPERNTDEI